MEIWKDITGYNGLYKISNKGRVLSLRKDNILKPIDSHGYKYVHLCNKYHKRKNKSVHRLVCEAFIDNPNNLPEINHIDGNKANNSVDNLEWCTPAQNSYHRANILNRNKRKVYCIETKQTFNSIKEAANYYHKTTAPLIAVLRNYKHRYTFDNKHWKYVI